MDKQNETSNPVISRRPSSLPLPRTKARRGRWIRIVAVLSWIAFIFFTSTSLASLWAEHLFASLSGALFGTLPNLPSRDGLLHLLADKGFHVAIFCVLALLLWPTLPETPRKPWFILLIGAIVGSCSEILQSFFPDRDPAFRDVVINTAGTALGVIVSRAFVKWKHGARLLRSA